MNVGLAVLHIVVGVLFVGHGAQKLFGAFGGHGLEGTAGFFESIGLRPGRVHAAAAGLAETAGGALLALGLLTPLGAALVTAVMTAAVLTVHVRNGVWVTQNGFEYNLVLVAAVFALAAVGAGTVSLDSALGLDVAGAGWALGALGAGLLGGLGAVLSGRLIGARSPVDAEHASTT
jgi:putative oxidoreductase